MQSVRAWLSVGLLILATPIAVRADGFSFSQNFIVLAPDQKLADRLLEQAERLRKELAVRWLGEELPMGDGRTLICVELSGTNREGGFWPIDDTRRTLHRLRLTASHREALPSILAHEVAHLVIQLGFQGELPIWADEGIAMFQDGEDFKSARRHIIATYARNDTWPQLYKVIEAERIKGDLESYAVAASLTSYLLTRSDVSTLVSFALAGKTSGWQAAAREYYGVTMSQLQAMWQVWAAHTTLTENVYAVPGYALFPTVNQR